MTDWVHHLAAEWGHWLRRLEAEGSLVQGTLGRIFEQGPVAAAIHTAYNSQLIPIREMPKRVAQFHSAWLTLDEAHQVLLFVEYKLRLGVKKKFRICNLKKDAYYRARAKAKLLIAEKIDSRNAGKRENAGV